MYVNWRALLAESYSGKFRSCMETTLCIPSPAAWGIFPGPLSTELVHPSVSVLQYGAESVLPYAPTRVEGWEPYIRRIKGNPFVGLLQERSLHTPLSLFHNFAGWDLLRSSPLRKTLARRGMRKKDFIPEWLHSILRKKLFVSVIPMAILRPNPQDILFTVNCIALFPSV